MPKKEELTPCIKKCELNTKEECISCGRTLEEIKLWSTFTTKQKIEIINQLQSRNQDKQENNNDSR